MQIKRIHHTKPSTKPTSIGPTRIIQSGITTNIFQHFSNHTIAWGCHHREHRHNANTLYTPQEPTGNTTASCICNQIEKDIEHTIENDVSILAMPETNLGWTETIHTEQYKCLLSTYYKHYKLISSTPNDITTQYHQMDTNQVELQLCSLIT